jgi:protoporphyrinogen oxidase
VTQKTAIIIGAGPAGLTAALELQRRSDVKVTVLEATNDIGGISKTVNYKGNRIDIGGHRFFSKSDWVMDWWRDILPVVNPGGSEEVEIAYQNQRRKVDLGDRSPALVDGDRVMLVRDRLSRIYFDGKFFDYPIKATPQTAWNLGPGRITKSLATYGWARMFPRKPELSLEDFLLNRFGSELYETFFREYTQKVWGVPCSEISADWGAQRIKSLSISKAIMHAMKKAVPFAGGGAAPTSLIERFFYPKFGPGQMWETVADIVKRNGGEIRMAQNVVGLEQSDGKITAVTALDTETNTKERLEADYIFSTMPVRDLIGALSPAAPQSVRTVGTGLQYRDFITVGILLNKLQPSRGAIAGHGNNLVPDNWIYIQDRGVQVGRLQFFNNWSPHMVENPNTVWVGMEYFCNETDEIWSTDDSKLIDLGISELQKIGLAHRDDLLDGTVIRQPKAYPGYFGSYDQFDTVREYTDSFENLYLIGRNGMHRYNNQDHSMLTARFAVESALTGNHDKAAIWDINIDDEYHEEQTVHAAEEDAKERAA